MRLKIYQINIIIIVLLSIPLGTSKLSAQDEVTTVPDVTGLNVPQASAELNRAGLRLGAISTQQWTATSPDPVGEIVTQSVAPGESVSIGTAIDISVLTTASIRLIYDDNDLTLINNTGSPFDLRQIVFSGTEGTRRFAASRWRSSLDVGECTQIWSISRFEPKAVDGCTGSTYWLTSNNTSEHFWTQTAGNDPFQIILNGTPAITCEAAPVNTEGSPLICELSVFAGTSANPVTSYVAFTYTTDQFLAYNASSDAWMPLDGTRIQIPGLEVIIGDLNLFGSPDTIGDLRWLAPQQCSMLFRSEGANTTPLEDCDLVARAEVAQNAAFWTVPFEIVPITRPDTRLSCPAATPGQTTICVMPR